MYKKAGQEIFVGSTSKAYRIYLPQSNKVILSIDVKFLALDKWIWENEKQLESHGENNDDADDQPVRGTRSFFEIYEGCNVALVEPSSYEEVATDQKWALAMKEEFNMIEKNQTWKLVNKPGVCSIRLKEEY